MLTNNLSTSDQEQIIGFRNGALSAASELYNKTGYLQAHIEYLLKETDKETVIYKEALMEIPDRYFEADDDVKRGIINSLPAIVRSFLKPNQTLLALLWKSETYVHTTDDPADAKGNWQDLPREDGVLILFESFNQSEVILATIKIAGTSVVQDGSLKTNYHLEKIDLPMLAKDVIGHVHGLFDKITGYESTARL